MKDNLSDIQQRWERVAHLAELPTTSQYVEDVRWLLAEVERLRLAVGGTPPHEPSATDVFVEAVAGKLRRAGGGAPQDMRDLGYEEESYHSREHPADWSDPRPRGEEPAPMRGR
jgi:hypothetical protein